MSISYFNQFLSVRSRLLVEKPYLCQNSRKNYKWPFPQVNLHFFKWKKRYNLNVSNQFDFDLFAFETIYNQTKCALIGFLHGESIEMIRKTRNVIIFK